MKIDTKITQDLFKITEFECPTCNGEGEINFTEYDLNTLSSTVKFKECEDCKGKGVIQ